MNKKTAIFLFSVFVVAAFLIAGNTMAQQANVDLVIEPSSATLNITSNQTVQLEAIYKGSQNVTDEVNWGWGLTSLEKSRLEMVSPGQFRSGDNAGGVLVSATYQDPSTGEYHSANANITVGGGISYGQTEFRPHDRNINVGEQIQLEYYIGEKVTCANPPCSAPSNQIFGQWFSLIEDTLQSLGGGLFRSQSEGYGVARISHSGGSAQTFVGVIDPNKPMDTSFDVSLVDRHPVYTWIDARYHNDGGYGPFTNIDYIPTSSGGRFAVLGECSDGRDTVFHDVEFEGGGLYVLSEDGQLIGKENVCKETSNWFNACYEGGGCTIGKDTHPTGSSGTFILDTGDGPTGAPRRSALLYNIGGSSMASENRLFFNDRNNPVEPTEDVEVTRFNNIAYANGVMVGHATETTGRTHARISGFPGPTRSVEVKNIFYSVPEFQRLAEISTPTRCSSRSCSGSPSVTQAVYTPLFGLGEYFVARDDSGYGVYRMPSRDELRNGVVPEKVQDISPPFGSQFNYFTYDATNSDRIMVTSLNPAGNYVIYEPGTDGLNEVDSGKLDTNFSFYNFALSGEYIAYTKCGSQEHPIAKMINTANIWSCELVVEKSGTELSVEPLPLNMFSPRSAGSMPAVAISPSGRILVTAHNMTGHAGDNDNLYLYQINELGGGVTPPITPPIIPPGGINPIVPTTTLGIQAYLDMAASYVRDFLSILGIESSETETEEGAGINLQTEEGIKSFQCLHGIVCSGTKETTGWGNLGPQTRAKIQEVYGIDLGAGDVRGASISLDNDSDRRSFISTSLNVLSASLDTIRERLSR